MTILDQAIKDLGDTLPKFGKPAVMSSFGKESMALLFCLREAGFRLPVIYLKDPWQPWKHAFAENIIREWDLTVHNWPPTGMGLKFNGNQLEFVARYMFSDNGWIDIPKNIEPQSQEENLLCGLYDIIRRPIATFRHPWDLILIGHKSTDKDQYYGNVPLKVDLKQGIFGEPALYFPLRNWTDEDIWNLIEKEGIPFQTDRYQNRQELSDKRPSNDYVQCCSRCLDPRSGDTVLCPKFNREINNVFKSVPHFDEKPTYIGGDQ